MSEQNYQLLVQRGPEPGKVYPLSSVSITIGRDPMADITITDPEVSRQHVRLLGTPYRILRFKIWVARMAPTLMVSA